MRTDPQLISAIRDHENHEAWRTFESRYAPIVIAYCVRMGLAWNAAEDAAQEAFLRICKHGFADRYDPALGTFRGYLFRIVRSVVASSRPLPQHQHGEETSSPRDPDEAWNDVWRSHAVRLALRRAEDRLSGRAKEVLSLSMRDVPPKVIAELTGMSRDAIYKIRERARAEIELACHELRLSPDEI